MYKKFSLPGIDITTTFPDKNAGKTRELFPPPIYSVDILEKRQHFPTLIRGMGDTSSSLLTQLLLSGIVVGVT